MKTDNATKLFFAGGIWLMVFAAAFVIDRCEADQVIPRIQLDNVPLADAVGVLARHAELNYILDPRVPGSAFVPGNVAPAPSVTANWTNVSAHAALRALLNQHNLTLVTNPVTTVTRITPVNSGAQPVAATRVGTNAGAVLPMITMEAVPVTEAILKLAEAVRLRIAFDPQVTSPDFANRYSVSFRWKDITARQALAALLDNYGLVMTEDATTASARVGLKPMSDPPAKKP